MFPGVTSIAPLLLSPDDESTVKATLAMLLGTNSEESVDYPDFAHKLTNEVLKDNSNLGILICGTGVGMSMAANRVKGIRAGLVSNNEIARLIRQHNNANVLVLPGRFMDEEEAIKSVKTFIETEFEAGRHQARIDKI